eukprot:10046751-Karenia_brevis.AAC.1
MTALASELNKMFEEKVTVARQPRPASDTVFACNHCGSTRVAQAPFDVHHPSKGVWCTKCAQSVPGSNWSCLCGKIWHHCT